jgi:hypothetical protein
MEQMGIVELWRRRVCRLVRSGRMSELQARRYEKVYGFLDAPPARTALERLRRLLVWPGDYPILQARFLASDLTEYDYRRALTVDFLRFWTVSALIYILPMLAVTALESRFTLDLGHSAQIAGAGSAFGLFAAALGYGVGRWMLAQVRPLRRRAEEDEWFRGEDRSPS